uniref:Uncharacterized protein n=1 Tax=Trichobilharzia regenti TaxID=157069 RepID=A0AA85J5P1_TRIRE|nr:unnamed protein product [Trichobilharzia regenti]
MKLVRNHITRLIAPSEAFVLLPERLCDVQVRRDTYGIRAEDCLSQLILSQLNKSKSNLGTKLIPLNWFNLLLEPQKMASVVAAILPIVSESNFNEEKLMKRCVVEVFPNIYRWNFKQLPNLQVVIVVPWPDPLFDLFDKNTVNCRTSYQGKSEDLITLGKLSTFGKSYFINLKHVLNFGTKIYFVPDIFHQSTAELAISLITTLSRGIFKDTNELFQKWLLTQQTNSMSNVNNYPMISYMLLHKNDNSLIRRLSLKLKKLTNLNDYKQFTRRRRRKGIYTKPKKMTSPSADLLPHCRPMTTIVDHSKDYEMMVTRRNTLPEIITSPLVNIRNSTFQLCKQIKGSRIGLIGLMNETSKQIALIAQSGLGMEVSYYQMHPLPDTTYKYYKYLEDLLGMNDYIILADDTVNQSIPWCLNTPVADKNTTNKAVEYKIKPKLWLSTEQLKYCNKEALLISVTSSQCIDFTALSLALRYRQLGGAGITIPTKWFTPMNEINVLKNLPNTFILPPATSSACSNPTLRVALVHEIINLIVMNLDKSAAMKGEKMTPSNQTLFKVKEEYVGRKQFSRMKMNKKPLILNSLKRRLSQRYREH